MVIGSESGVYAADDRGMAPVHNVTLGTSLIFIAAWMKYIFCKALGHCFTAELLCALAVLPGCHWEAFLIEMTRVRM